MSYFFQPTLSHWFGHAACPAATDTSIRDVPRLPAAVSHAIAQALAKRKAVRDANADTPSHHLLDRHATFWVIQPLARQIRCDAGVLWLTFDGEVRDVVLEAGQTHLCQNDAPLAIHALQQGAFQIA
jgi:Protein of unknown function (DUF2917)